LDLDEIHLVNIDFESTQALINELYNISETRNNNNYNQRNNQNEKILVKPNIENEKSPNKIKHQNDKKAKKELFNFDKSTDDFTRICDFCGQRIRVYMKVYKCGHVYCMGCKIDYENNKKSCLLFHNDIDYNQIDDVSNEDQELNESINKMEINDSTDKDNEIKNKNEKKDNLCEICYEFDKEIKLNKCEHSFCKNCHDKIMKTNPKCPFCQTIYGILTGNQPKNGRMSHALISDNLPGYSNCNTIQINYQIPNGIQGPDHPNPGKPYNGINRTAYLPNNREGNYILKLLYKAFENGLTFTIGNSRTTNAEGVITWNDIHHKTHINGE
jgi:deltex-like protein